MPNWPTKGFLLTSTEEYHQIGARTGSLQLGMTFRSGLLRRRADAHLDARVMTAERFGIAARAPARAKSGSD